MDKVQYLLSIGVEQRPDFEGNWPLMVAIVCGNLEMVKCLLAHGAPVNICNKVSTDSCSQCSLLHMYWCNDESARVVMVQRGETVLHCACSDKAGPEIVHELVGAGADLAAVDNKVME